MAQHLQGHLRLGRLLSPGWLPKSPKDLSWANVRKKKAPEPLGRWNIVRGDMVCVVNGKCEGQRGVVQHVLRQKQRVIVEGVNVGKRMLYDANDPNRVKRPVEAPRSIHYSNVNLVCPITNKPTRVRRGFLGDGTAVRIAVRSGAFIHYPKWERRSSRSTTIGDKDTLEEDVLRVTYDPTRDCDLWEKSMVDGVRHLHIYDEGEG